MNKDNSKTYIWLFIGIVAIFGIFVYFRTWSRVPAGKYDVFAQCLAQKNVTMYGTKTCPWCAKEKANFGSSFDIVPYVECTENIRKCLDEKIEGYPTWIFPDGKRLLGYQGLEVLARASNCELPE